jgi:hypothetical protein
MKIADWTVWVLLVAMVLIVGWQVLDYFHFRQAGPRFTASDGQELCWSVQELQRYNGLPVRECEFVK